MPWISQKARSGLELCAHTTSVIFGGTSRVYWKNKWCPPVPNRAVRVIYPPFRRPDMRDGEMVVWPLTCMRHDHS